MSLASEYARLSDETEFYCPNTGEVVAKVDRDGCFQWVHTDHMLSADEALALADWIRKVFGEGER